MTKRVLLDESVPRQLAAVLDAAGHEAGRATLVRARPGGAIVEPGLRTETEGRWREIYAQTGKPDLESFRAQKHKSVDAAVTLGASPADRVVLADEVIAQLSVLGLDVLYDDRDERPGVKFKDADLIGIPIRIAVGRRGLADRTVEWKLRTSAASEAIAVKEVGRRAASVVE